MERTFNRGFQTADHGFFDRARLLQRVRILSNQTKYLGVFVRNVITVETYRYHCAPVD